MTDHHRLRPSHRAAYRTGRLIGWLLAHGIIRTLIVSDWLRGKALAARDWAYR